MNFVMKTNSTSIFRTFFVMAMICAACFTTGMSSVHAQVRTKKPDRGVYQPGGNTIYPTESSSSGSAKDQRQDSDGVSWNTTGSSDSESLYTDADENSSNSILPVRIEPLRMRELPSANNLKSNPARTPRLHQVDDPRSVRLESLVDSREGAVEGNNARLVQPTRRHDSIHRVSLESPIYETPIYDQGFDCQCGGDGCDSCGYDMGGGCDGYGCDAMGCNDCGFGGQRCANGSLCFDPCRWFASMEVLLLWRKGDFIPALVTTSPDGTLVDDAGELPGATVLAGQRKLFDDLTAGGRFTLGTWIDDCHNRSIVGRLWSATEADYSFSARESINSGGILAIPTTNGGVADAALIAFPDSDESSGRFGSVNVSAESNVAGGDLSVRQRWTGGLGTTFDVLYGYQYMRLDEELRLSSTSTLSQQQLPTEIGDNLTTSDSFDTTNQFHGGQFGLAGRYREGCWSFDWLAKFGFGQLRRTAERRGSSVITTSTPPAATNDTGILVTDVNRGIFSDDTFGWIPELDVSVGWHKYPRFDVTFGYNLIAMTDAIRLSDAMDPDNDVDNPRVGLSDDTFYLQGLHFGIRHVY